VETSATDSAEGETKVFISYRRVGEPGFVGRLTDRLSTKYGPQNVFRDVVGTRSGEDFEKRILAKLSEATVVIAVIGSEWVGRRPLRKPRIQAREDWVRKELEHALASNTPVIPILIDGARLPTREQLPRSLQGLLSVHAGRVRDESWESDCGDLIRAIDSIASSGAGADDGNATVVWRQFEGEPSSTRMWLFVPLLVTVAAGIAAAAMQSRSDPSIVYRDKPVEVAVSSVRLDDPATWTAPASKQSRSRVSHLALQLALLEMHASTKEARGQNDGFNVEKFTARFSKLGADIPWNAAFACWCYLEALRRLENDSAAKLPFRDSPTVQVVADSLREHGWLVQPFDALQARPGDPVFLRRRDDDRLQHVELIYAVSGTTVCSIGGNTANGVRGQCRPLEPDKIAALGVPPEDAFGPSPH
jgi:hypothetical protein